MKLTMYLIFCYQPQHYNKHLQYIFNDFLTFSFAVSLSSRVMNYIMQRITHCKKKREKKIKN